jgi:hypothetical protein
MGIIDLISKKVISLLVLRSNVREEVPRAGKVFLGAGIVQAGSVPDSFWRRVAMPAYPNVERANSADMVREQVCAAVSGR